MFRALATWTASVVIWGGGAALAQEPPPPLEAPAAESQPAQPVAPPSQPKPAARAPVASPSPLQSRPFTTPTGLSQIRPLLVIPGVTSPTQSAAMRPRSNSASSVRPGPVTGPQDGYPSPPALPEAGSPFRAPVARQLQGQPAPAPATATATGPPPITLEPIEDLPEAGPRNSPSARGPANRAPERLSPATRPAESSKPAQPPLWRPPGFLGRLLGLPPEPAPRIAPRGDEMQGRVEPPRGARDEAHADPASDAAARRRIERHIREELGDRLRSVEVRVTGRNVLIVARPSRFWQKRSIRRTLEGLPILDGYRARIDVGD